MSERVRGSYDNALYKSTYTLLTLLYDRLDQYGWLCVGESAGDVERCR